MDGVVSPADQQSLVSSFLEIAAGQSAATARQFLEATGWKLEEAVLLFYAGNDGGIPASSSQTAEVENNAHLVNQTSSNGLSEDFRSDVFSPQVVEDDVRAPLPVIREALYDDALIHGFTQRFGPPSAGPSSVVAFRNFQEEIKQPGVWESEKSGGPKEDSRDNLAALYRPPFSLMLQGPFEKAKLAAAADNKWLLVNLQSTREFSSHMLNRDTWANEAVAQTIKTNFIFWQVYDNTSEGSKVCTYYKVESVPVVLVIDPITGQKMRSWSGMVHSDRLLEDLLPFMDGGPCNHNVPLSHKRPRESSKNAAQKIQDEEAEEMRRALAASLESLEHPVESASEVNDTDTVNDKVDGNSEKKPSYPPLPDEPKGDRSLLCRVGFRLPDGRRVQRNFLRSDPIQLLWSFCMTQIPEADTRPFRLMHAIPGASTFLEYDSKLTFEESKLANSMISVTWE